MLALIGMPLLFIVFIIVAPAIYLEDKGPVFYYSLRLGKNGKIFRMYKFRSMKINVPDIRNVDGSTYNSEDDIRLTKTGKFIRNTSLDEAPQLFNVLKGEMSVIGPRPDLPEHYNEYIGNEIRKLEISPGITGFSQAYFRNAIPWKNRIQHDIYYIDNVSFWLDLKIFFKTAVSVLGRKNIHVLQTQLQSQQDSEKVLVITKID